VANQQRRADVTLTDAFPYFDGAREVATDAGHDPADAAGTACCSVSGERTSATSLSIDRRRLSAKGTPESSLVSRQAEC
jgi:hypothetical protein